jgi:hypothetical protein
VRRSCYLRAFAQTPCAGRLQKCHLIKQQTLRRECKDARPADACWWVWGCVRHHDELDKSRRLRIPRHRLPGELEAAAAKHGISWWLDTEYGVAQLRAFDVERARKRLDVRPGHSSWWGVDPSTKRIAIATVGPHGERAVRSLDVPKGLAGASRLEAIRTVTIELCALVASCPGVVLVEEPAGFGKRPNPELAYAVGAVLCGLVVGAPFTHVDFVASARWKLQVCGYGAIAKPKPSSKREYEVLRWARDAGYEGVSWDEADAWAIAEYAHDFYELVQP